MKRLISIILILVIAFSACACGGTAKIGPTPEPTEAPIAFSDNPEAIAKASESVVMLTCYNKKGEPICTGSAFQCFEEGVYITNYHVIDGVDKIQANTESKLYFDIENVIATDRAKDIAILQTSAKPGVAVLPDGDSDSLIKGEDVTAIGSPEGFLNTVSKGTYSGSIDVEGRNYIQFSAAISAGSSGGALFNDSGEVIGITSATYTEGQNLNFAVPINAVKKIWDERDTTDASSEIETESTDSTDVTSVSYFNEYIRDDPTIKNVTVSGYVTIKVKECTRYVNVKDEILYFLYLVDNKSDVDDAEYTKSFSQKAEGFYSSLREKHEDHITGSVLAVVSEEDYKSIQTGDFITASGSRIYIKQDLEDESSPPYYQLLFNMHKNEIYHCIVVKK